MQISASATEPVKQSNSCVVVTAFIDGTYSRAAKHINKKSNNALDRALKRGDIKGELGHTVILHELPGIPSERVLVVGAGPSGAMSSASFRTFCIAIASALKESGATQASLYSAIDVSVQDQSLPLRCQQLALTLEESQYQFTAHQQSKQAAPAKLKKCVLIVAKTEQNASTRAIKRGSAVARGMASACDLGNLAANICTPGYLAAEARKLGRKHVALKIKINNEAQMKKLGMGAFLSVSQGSAQPAKLICMEYLGAKPADKPLVLLGKGVTFDTGGISIKPSAAMDEMKFDMCGAASVLGAMRVCCELKLKCNIIGVIAAAENMPGSNATRPGDVIRTMSGQTVEVLNTDAEGRMVLCDSLTYIKRYEPSVVIDIATLTGACMVALGDVASAVFANDQELADQLVDAGQRSGDLSWQLPLWEEYQPQLDSNFADMANIGGKYAGAVTAACFLSRFVDGIKWAHLDVAGTAWRSGANKGATGRPVPLLMQYVFDHFAD